MIQNLIPIKLSTNSRTWQFGKQEPGKDDPKPASVERSGLLQCLIFRDLVDTAEFTGEAGGVRELKMVTQFDLVDLAPLYIGLSESFRNLSHQVVSPEQTRTRSTALHNDSDISWKANVEI